MYNLNLNNKSNPYGVRPRTARLSSESGAGFNQLNNFAKGKINAKRYSTGFTLIELIIAIAVLSFGVVMVYGSFYDISTATYSISSRFTATYLAQEGLEIIRNIRDTNFINSQTWSAGLTGSPCNTGCQLDYKLQNASQLAAYNDNVFLGLNSDGFYSYDTGSTPTIFKRKITITPISSDILNVEVLTTWNYKGQVLSFKIEESLYNWR